MWTWIHIAACLAGGTLAASGMIIAKKPAAKEYIDKLAPYQGSIGVTMLGLGVWHILNGGLRAFSLLGALPLMAIAILAVLFSEVVVGFLLGFGLIAKWIPGESKGEQKAAGLQRKLVSVQVPLGFVSIIAGLLLLVVQIIY